MVLISIILASTVVCAACHALLINRLRRVYARSSPQWTEETHWPKAAIVLSLRGHDPFLITCLRNLIHQDYPDFFLQVIVDSETDPAWEAIETIRPECRPDHMRVSVLANRSSSRSLKNSAVLQAIRSLPPDCEVVAFVDADAITHPQWLKSLVSPLADTTVGCSTGIRWFAGGDQSIASRLRCDWNLFAAPIIHASGIPWGGSMALPRRVLEMNLPEEWESTFCEDAPTANFLRRHKLKLCCVPQATLVNQERTTVGACYQFICRQMLIFRLYHPLWWPLFLVIVSATVLRFTHLFLILKSVVSGELVTFVALAVVYSIIPIATRYQAHRLYQAVQSTVARTGQQISANRLPDILLFFCAEAMAVGSTLAAPFARFAKWRGITYQIAGSHKIRMIGYHPFVSTSQAPVGQYESVR